MYTNRNFMSKVTDFIKEGSILIQTGTYILFLSLTTNIVYKYLTGVYSPVKVEKIL